MAVLSGWTLMPNSSCTNTTIVDRQAIGCWLAVSSTIITATVCPTRIVTTTTALEQPVSRRIHVVHTESLRRRRGLSVREAHAHQRFMHGDETFRFGFGWAAVRCGHVVMLSVM